MCACAQSLSPVQLSVSPWTADPRLLCPWGSPGEKTGVGGHAPLQGVFLTQGSNPRLGRRTLHHFTPWQARVWSFSVESLEGAER